ncbi:4-hydroxy-tetrahydrodipicolinate synthase [Aerococcaceae bacterium DSM 111020]|nr:4-hydroxy-tetrahydrodipicolinate synthase [Aerococcaceae bacterium DSM 111020]
MTHIYTGSGVAIITPFVANTRDIDWQAFERLLDFHLEHRTDAIIVTGTTGESATMTDEEQMDVIEFAVKHVNGRKPVIAGTGINDTMHSIKLSQQAEAAGADALLIVTPYYNKANDEGLMTHFTMIAESVQIPIILYDVPGRTGISLRPEQIAELAKFENIVALKDAVGDLEYTQAVMDLVDDNFAIYSGNDDLNLEIVKMGGQGAISVTANVMPNEVHDVIQFAIEGREKEAQTLNDQMNAINHDLFIEVNPIPVKYIASKLGWADLTYRLPLAPPSKETQEILNQYIEVLAKDYQA